MNWFDLQWFQFFNGLSGRSSMLDFLITFFANYSLELYALLFIIAWVTLPKREVNRRHALVVMVLSGALGLAVNALIAHIWFRPRPFTVLPKGTFSQLIQHAADTSFPSDHTTGSFGFAAASWGKANYWVRISFTLLAFCTAIARICAGVHWPTDVLAGIVIGSLSGLLMWKFSSFLRPLTNFGLRLFRYGQFAKQNTLPSTRS
ncbi:phosphatase PAP2 family protein [Desulfotruncus alcoholivorax]|uniref:phosphatase PAP2 family protein n=1 Tax=Desulfotruncus alcoholivorax TaxID=265477 RepID=UPI0004886625|nr:phosphatase PAP2 family protein [Desulfotruncus alcoholivorax]